MKVKTWTHDEDGVLVIEYQAECDEDRKANAALFARYDSQGVIGSASSDGEHLQLLVLPFSAEEIAEQREADRMIGGLNELGTSLKKEGFRPSVVTL